MATFSENQVRQLYVVNGASTFEAAKCPDNGALYFTMVDANGKPVRSDLIENIMYAKSTSSDKMKRELKAVKVTMDSTALTSQGKPIAGEDYTLRIEYSQFIALSDEVFYHEIASAHATNGSTVSSLLLDLAKNLVKNTKAQGLVHVTLDTATSGEVEVSAYASSDGAVQGIIITEIEQDWTLGVKQQSAVMFTVKTGVVSVNGDELNWGVITSVHSQDFVLNGKTIADMEYFYHGERGDIYRNVGWPDVVPTKYMVNPALEYDVIDIHFAYVGANHAVQKSEKDITIVCPNDGSHTVANDVIGEINTAYGSTLIAAL